MKVLGLFTIAALLSGAGLSEAADLSAVTSAVKGTKAYQSRVLSDVRPEDEVVPLPATSAVSVEPASGEEVSADTSIETPSEMIEGSEAIRSLQEGLSIPAN